MSDPCKVTFQPVGKRVNVPSGTTLLEAGQIAGIALSANCGGVGICGRCCVDILPSAAHNDGMEAPTETEVRILSKTDMEKGQRLACRARIKSAVEIHIPPFFLGSGQRFQIESAQRKLEVNPRVERVSLNIPAPDREDVRSDFVRICQALTDELGEREWVATAAVLAQLTKEARRYNWHFTTYACGHEIIGFSGLEAKSLGIAIDLGCTKVAGYLMDMDTGEQIAAGGVSNPQISYGEDLITRLVYASKGEEEACLISSVIQKAINELSLKLCQEAGFDPQEIVEICIVGNTAMVHLLLNLPVLQLLHSPFISAFEDALDLDAYTLGFAFAPACRLHILPSIGGFVGADHVAMIIAQEIEKKSVITLGIDIGTNTEIVLYNPDKSQMLTTSVPSGPAFEGGHISDGMRAASGAIEEIRLNKGTLHLKTVDDKPPVGLCGSGVIDTVAMLWQNNIINSRGHLVKNALGVKTNGAGKYFLIQDKENTGHGRDIIFTQKDVSEVQLAKAAIFAAIQSLLEITDISLDCVEEFIIAGAFGAHLNLSNAIKIGLLPRFPNARYIQAGNAAGAGSKMALLSFAVRERAIRIARQAERIELKEHKNFNRLLTKATQFPNNQTKRNTAKENFNAQP